MALGWAQTPGLSARRKGHCCADPCTEKVILPIIAGFPLRSCVSLKRTTFGMDQWVS